MKRIIALALAIAAAGLMTAAALSTANPRSGTMHVTKTCPPSQYQGQAGGFCTITSSNINAIKPGSRVVYASAVSGGRLNSDLAIDGPGNNTAYGHVVLDLSTFTGTVTFSGGTGVFSHFSAGPIAVACPEFPDCSWDGPYSFDPKES